MQTPNAMHQNGGKVTKKCPGILNELQDWVNNDLEEQSGDDTDFKMKYHRG